MRDPLSDILSAMQVSGVSPVRFESRGKYAMRFPAFRHLKFGAVLSGALELVPTNGPSIRLSAGDCYLMTDGAPYVSRTADVPATDGERYFAEHRGPDGIVRLGDGPPDKIVIGGRFTFDDTGAEWLRLALPPAIRIGAESAVAEPLRTTLALLANEVAANGIGEELVVARIADILLVQALRAYLAETREHVQSWLAGMSDPRLGRALRAFHANVAHDWTLNGLAAEAGMSRSSFADVFARRTGLTPMAYVARWRLFRIRADVMQTTKPLSQITDDTGWRSRTSCSRAFKDLFGISPREARRASAGL